MKLAIATGILAAKTLPVLSEESSAEAIDYARSPLENERFIPTTNKKHHQQQYRTGTKKDRTGGSLFHQSRRHGNKLLVNKALPPNNEKTLCDPSLPDADIGMLSCGLGYECIVDEASSPMGGVCEPTTSRQLQEENEICYLCSEPFTVAPAKYDIVIEDAESGYGGKTCGDLDAVAYYTLSLNASRCEVVASAARAAGCCATPKCDLCEFGSFVPRRDIYSDSVILDYIVDGISLPGYDEPVTCENLAYATYRKGAVDLESCPATRQAAMEAGCCVQYFCLTCDAETYIPPEETLNTTACNELRASNLLYYNNTISEESCLAATQAATDEGCCVPRPVYDSCDVCGNATFYPENPMYRLGTCEIAKSRLNDEYCVTFGPDLVPFCCGPSSLPADDDNEEAPGPAPTPSAASALLSAGPLVVSMMCLTSSTLSVAGWWLLELN
jgi:hypothetical protein